MKRLFTTILSIFVFLFLCSHDMFLKFDTYFLEPNSEAFIQLFNGSYDKSDNTIDRNRMVDVSIVSNGNRVAMDTTRWFEKDSITVLKLKTKEAGTYVAGVSTKPRTFKLDAEKFNDYLKNDGVLDILENRKKENKLNLDAVEKYSKHVKSIFQVGKVLSSDYNANLGYPIEFIPLENPYEIHPGHNLPIKLLLDGKPLPNHFVYVGHKHTETKSHSHKHNNKTHQHQHSGDDETHNHNHKDSKVEDSKHGHDHNDVTQFMTNENGIVNVPISEEGVWYIRTIHMVELNSETLTHESNWATLTFGVGSGLGHSHDHLEDHNHGNNHTHHDESEFPTYWFLVISAIIFLLLFLWYSKKK